MGPATRRLRPAALAMCVVVMLLSAGCTLADFREGGLGSAAHDLVSGKKYANLVVEIDHPPGWAPHEEALRVLRATLQDVTDKQKIDFVLDASIPTSNKKYSYAEIRELESKHRDHRTGGDTAALYVLYVAGGSEGDSGGGRVLGAHYAATSLVIFNGNIRDISCGLVCQPGQPRAQNVERAVLVHEFGHAAGLINMGAPMTKAREDPDSKGHSTNQNSVMYHAVKNSADLLKLLTLRDSIPYQFDADDKADLRRLREQ